jgi:hypothetical protein
VRQTVIGTVEDVGKPLNFEFPRQKVLYFQGANFSKESFSTASLARVTIIGSQEALTSSLTPHQKR